MSAEDWEDKNDPWPDADDDGPAASKASKNRYRPVVLRPSKVREIVRKSSGKRVASDFVALLDQMVVIAIEKLSTVHDGGTKTLSARLLSTCPVRMTSIAPIGDSMLLRRRKKKVSRADNSKDKATIVRKVQPVSKSRTEAVGAPSGRKAKPRSSSIGTEQGTLFPV
ncbi:MAG: hypothetical protein AAB229_01230 [Candidatus Hydrogenedentota bacterium]